LLAETEKIERFHEEFQKLQGLMEVHADKKNRSLLKVYIDNLSFPARFDRHVNTLRCLETPKEIKTKFSEYVIEFENALLAILD